MVQTAETVEVEVVGVDTYMTQLLEVKTEKIREEIGVWPWETRRLHPVHFLEATSTGCTMKKSAATTLCSKNSQRCPQPCFLSLLSLVTLPVSRVNPLGTY
jgi:hypothetical protein